MSCACACHVHVHDMSCENQTFMFHSSVQKIVEAKLKLKGITNISFVEYLFQLSFQLSNFSKYVLLVQHYCCSSAQRSKSSNLL